MKEITIFEPQDKHGQLMRNDGLREWRIKNGIFSTSSTHAVVIRVSAMERELIKKAAEKTGLTISAFCRDVCVQVAHKIMENQVGRDRDPD